MGETKMRTRGELPPAPARVLSVAVARRRTREIESLREQLNGIQADMVAASSLPHRRLPEAHPNLRESARDLLRYLARRGHDIRPLQLLLAALGLSSLGRAESESGSKREAMIHALG